MACTDFDQRWWPLVEQLLTEMKAWRLEHPTASFSTIETALDARLHALRARMLEDLSLATSAALFRAQSAETRPRCPTCDCPLQARGEQTRHLQTNGGQQLALPRTYGHCSACNAGLFPPG